MADGMTSAGSKELSGSYSRLERAAMGVVPIQEHVEAPVPPRPEGRGCGRGRVPVPVLGRLPIRRVLIIAAWLVFAAVSGWHRLAGLDPGRTYLFAIIMVPMAGFLGFVLCGSLGERTRRPVPRLPWRWPAVGSPPEDEDATGAASVAHTGSGGKGGGGCSCSSTRCRS